MGLLAQYCPERVTRLEHTPSGEERMSQVQRPRTMCSMCRMCTEKRNVPPELRGTTVEYTASDKQAAFVREYGA